MNKGRWWIVMACLAWMTGCVSSTKLVQSWQSPDVPKKEYHRVMVMAVTGDDVSRRAYEAAFVARLEQKKGREGIQANALMPDIHQYEQESSLRKALKTSGADMVIIASLISVDKRQRYVPPRFQYMPAFGMGFGYYSYSAMSVRAIYVPGHVRTDVVVRLEVTAFDVASEKMLWAGTTHTFNPSSDQKVINENIEVVMREMKKAGIL